MQGSHTACNSYNMQLLLPAPVQAPTQGQITHDHADTLMSWQIWAAWYITRPLIKRRPKGLCPFFSFLSVSHGKVLPVLQIVHMEDIPARQPQYALPSVPLSEPVQAALQARNITQMFTHQAKAIDTVLAGKNVVVSTSTASGKSLCYNIPILEALVQDRRACALYMFPTKVQTLTVHQQHKLTR